MTDGRAYGCGRDCSAPRDYVTDARPRELVDPDLVAAHGPDAIAWADEDDRRIAYHEAGHATLGALYGRPAEFAVLGPTPHVLCLPESKRTFEAVLIGLLAARQPKDALSAGALTRRAQRRWAFTGEGARRDGRKL
jgi:hypothetical protein